MAATEELRTRAQRNGESCFDYVQAILKLCRDADRAMAETVKIEHILKGIAENVFYLLHVKNVSTVDEILRQCRDLRRSPAVAANWLCFRGPATTEHHPLSYLSFWC